MRHFLDAVLALRLLIDRYERDLQALKGTAMLTQAESAALVAELKATVERYTQPILHPPPPPPTLGDWRTLGPEGGRAVVAPDSTVRYGAQGRFVIKRMSGAFTIDNATFGDPIRNVVKSADLWIGSGTPPAETGPIAPEPEGSEPPTWQSFRLADFPLAPGPAPLTDSQHASNFGRLWAMDPQGRLAAVYTASGEAGDWYQRHQLDVASDRFGGSTQALAVWRNRWSAVNNVATDEEYEGLARMLG